VNHSAGQLVPAAAARRWRQTLHCLERRLLLLLSIICVCALTRWCGADGQQVLSSVGNNRRQADARVQRHDGLQWSPAASALRQSRYRRLGDRRSPSLLAVGPPRRRRHRHRFAATVAAQVRRSVLSSGVSSNQAVCISF